MKMLLGNALFAAVMGAWYLYVEGNTNLMLSGAVMAFICFLCGIFMGYLLRGPGKRPIQRSAMNVRTGGFPVGIPVAHRETSALPTDAAFAAAEAEHHEPPLPDIPGPDDLDAMESTPPAGASPAASVPEHSTEAAANVVDPGNHHSEPGFVVPATPA